MTQSHFTSAAAPAPQPLCSIQVPQACFGIAQGPAGPVNLIAARVVEGVAVALVAHLQDERYPLVVMGRLDDQIPPAAASGLLLGCMAQLTAGKNVSRIEAHIVNDNGDPDLYEPVIHVLKRAGCECSVSIMDAELSSCAVSLETGDRLDITPDAQVGAYIPNQVADRLFTKYRFGSRDRHPLYPQLPGAVMALAFNLMDGVPSYYEPKPQGPSLSPLPR